MKIYKSKIGLILTLIVWGVVTKLEIWSAYILPSPIKVLNSFLQMVISGEVFIDSFISFQRVILGFLLAFFLAFTLGMIMFLSKRIGDYFKFIDYMKNIPPLSMVPLLILWFGIGESSKIILIIYSSFFPMYFNILKGFNTCDPKLLEVGEIFGFNRRKKFFKIILPHASLDILVGMKVGLGYAWRSIIGAEMVAASSGLGHLIIYSQEVSRSDKVIVGIIVIGIVAYLSDLTFDWIIKRFFKGEILNERH